MNPSLLSLPIGGALPRDPYLVRRLRLIPCRLAGVADHDNCIPDISMQANPIKQADHGVECTLEPAGVRRGNHAIVGVEEGSLVPTLLSTLAPLLRARYHYRHPVAHHHIHNYIKYGGGELVSLRPPRAP